jgi:hypothetical protein
MKCIVTVQDHGFTVSADRDYGGALPILHYDASTITLALIPAADEGEELYITYGRHPTDFLLTECRDAANFPSIPHDIDLISIL